MTVTEGTEQSSGWVRRLKRHKWKEDSNEAQTSNTAPHLDSVIGGKTTTAKESNAPKRDKRNGMGKRAKPVMGVNNISNSTLAKKSKENKDSGELKRLFSLI